MTHEELKNDAPTAEASGFSRRGFLRGLGGAAAASAALTTVAGKALVAPETAAADDLTPDLAVRRNQAWIVRRDAAGFQKAQGLAAHASNDDESRYADLRGQFSKTLPHNNLGEVDPAAYAKLVAAASSEVSADWGMVPRGATGKLVNPQGGKNYSFDGGDSNRFGIPAAPSFRSAWEAGEMVEVYWRALTRDVPFVRYNTNPTIAAAIADLNKLSDLRVPKVGGRVTASTIFRGPWSGDLTGPIVSQFLWQPIPYGAQRIDQRYAAPVSGNDHMVLYEHWLSIQNGGAPITPQVMQAPRYISNGRDIAEWVHRDFTYQGFLNAALILLGYGAGALDPANPYRTAGFANQGGFITYGGADILDLVARAGNAGLKAAWFQKWWVHRRLRPEVFAGRVHHRIVGTKNYDVHADVLNSDAADVVFNKHGNYLLPMAYPEGSPAHPAYPAGHATISGACATVLKWFFNEAFVIPNPVIANFNGSALRSITDTLTVGGELNKLATNISVNRDTAGVHWRTDGEEGMLLGEQVAIAMLQDHVRTYREQGLSGLSFRGFRGNLITI